MSRLYEALKEANRKRGSENGQDPLLEALQINALEAPLRETPVELPAAAEVPLNGHTQQGSPANLSYAVEVDFEDLEPLSQGDVSPFRNSEFDRSRTVIR